MTHLRIPAVIFTLLLCAMTHMFAQDSRGRVSGQVLDPTGGAVPDATVLAINDATGVTVRTVTNVAGAYRSLSHRTPSGK